jgi:RecG-like helicase
MKTLWSLLTVLAVVGLLVGAGFADAKPAKEVTLKGKITCAKCELNEGAKCANVIIVKEGGKDVVYYFIDKGAGEKYHKEICKEGKEGTVTGVVSEQGGKKMIKPSKVNIGGK